MLLLSLKLNTLLFHNSTKEPKTWGYKSFNKCWTWQVYHQNQALTKIPAHPQSAGNHTLQHGEQITHITTLVLNVFPFTASMWVLTSCHLQLKLLLLSLIHLFIQLHPVSTHTQAGLYTNNPTYTPSTPFTLVKV